MDTPDEKPWNEAQWERFLQRSEARSARYGELLETLMDDPNQEQIIAKEMGWDEIVDDDDGDFDEEFVGDDEVDGDTLPFDSTATKSPNNAKDAEAIADDASDEASTDEQADSAFDSDSGVDDLDFPDFEGDERRPNRKTIPAYNLAFEVGLEVHRALKPFMERLDFDDPLDDAGERLVSAYGNSLIPAAKISAAKISAGNAMGYEDESICGQIVIVRKGFAACVTAIEDLAWLKSQNSLPAEIATSCLEQLELVRQAIEERIAELRARVWWD